MRTLIRDVRVFDGERTTARTAVLVEDERIAEPDGHPVDVEVDGAGKTLLPGLIDAHVHVFDGNLAQALGFGVTTELDMFCLPPNLARQRRLAAERDDVADLRSAGVLATAPGGHPSQLLSGPGAAALGDAAGPFDTVSDLRGVAPFVDARLAQGVDYLKIVIDDGALTGSSMPTLTPDVVTALVEAAHSAGLQAIAHAVTAQDAVVALDAGVDGLAHVWSDAGPDERTEELAATIAAHGVFVTSTLSWFTVVTGSPGGPDAGPIQAVRALHRAGVQLLAGTDATPFAPLHGADMHNELALLAEAGVPNEEVLAAATSVPARHFGLADRGRIAPGLRADLLLVDGDPTHDITATRSVAGVWRRGVRRPESRS